MIRKTLTVVLLILLMFPLIVLASNNTGAKVGNKYYDNLSDAISAAKENEIIKLLSNASLEKGIILTKNLTIDLNDNTITSPTAVFEVQKGTLTLTGKGVIKETAPNYGVIRIIGSETPTDEKYSTVSIGKDVTLEGWAGIFVSHKNKKSFDSFVYLEGTINAVSDTQGNKGIGIYVNGSIQDKNNEPVINILDGANINSNGFGLYIGGYSNVFINKANITGTFGGIAIKAGKLEIDGAVVTCTGKDETPTESNADGIIESGTTIQIESNKGYAGDIKLEIKDGKFISKNSNVIYEYVNSGSETQVKNINISGGTYVSEANKNVFLLSDSFKNSHPKFISGGKFSSNINDYLLSGYSTNLDDSYYVVTSSAMKSVFSEKNNTNNILLPIITIVIFAILILMSYLNREKIIKLIKK